MSQWKSFANTSGAPKWGAQVLGVPQGSGASNKAGNATSAVVNTTPGAWHDPSGSNTSAMLNNVAGIFPITPQAKANTSGESGKVHGLGWALRREWEGPILTVAAANGSGFANGETVVASGGSVNAVISLTANATGNLTSATPQSSLTGGLFPNTSAISVTFTREKHVTQVAFTGTNATFEASAAIITVTGTNLSYGVAATANATTNSTGGFTAAVATFGNTPGLFGAAQVAANCTVVVTLASNGQVIGGLTPTVTLATSTGGVVNGPTLGGRAGRVAYEMLVIDRHLANGTSTVANSAQLPQ